MKKLFLLLTTILLMCPIAFADADIDAKINSIVKYAEQYEAGQLSYIQLKVYSTEIRNNLNELLGEKIEITRTNEIGEQETWQQQGFSPETVKKLFGTPTETTSWAWSPNSNKPIKLDEKMPRWEKILFDGRNIQIIFNAHPQVVKKADGTLYPFYWVDFQVRFKKDMNIDADQATVELKALAQDFQEGKTDGEELAKKIVTYRRAFRNYLDQNKGACESTIANFFKPEEKMSQQERITWESTLFSGDVIELQGRVDICDSCEWPWTNIWVEPRIEGPMPEKSEVKQEDREQLRKELEKLTVEQLESKLKQSLEEIIKLTKEADKNEGKGIENIYSKREILNEVNNMLNQRAMQDDRTKKEDYEKRKAFLKSLLEPYGTIEEIPLKETRYERRILTETKQMTNKNCRSIERECKPTEGCANGECVFALGGTESTGDLCHNNIDDDGDGAIDCADPDCAKDCGRLCEDQCDDCWKCHGNKCQTECSEQNKICGNMGPGQEPSSECRTAQDKCNQCRKDKCPTECAPCDKCEQEMNQFANCGNECQNCNSCKSSGAEDCSQQCDTCNKCSLPSELETCKSVCNEMSAEKEACITLCNKGTLWFCAGGIIQKKPCEGMLYQCGNSTLLNHLPCEMFTCTDGTIQNVPCNQKLGCGSNQKLENNECLCLDGYSDCNNDVTDGCESSNGCSATTETAEICDNKIDDNSNQLIDCEEISQCNNRVCDTGKKCNFNGECTAEEIPVQTSITQKTTGPALQGGSQCVIREDCNNENAVCSNGVCKTIDQIVKELNVPAPQPEQKINIPSGEGIQIQSKQEDVNKLTGDFIALITGKATEDKCSSEKDCNSNQNCDTFQGTCNCNYKFFDCNGDGQGNDADGCESTNDPTCGGTRELCPWGCKTHQTCSKESGNCECDIGFWDCDGDWENGCEATESCNINEGDNKGTCTSDDQCAKDKCATYDNVVMDFGCYESGSWNEDKGAFSFSGGCNNYQTGKIDSYLEFQSWGEAFDKLREKQEQAETALGPDWCKWELENAIRERKELEKSFNEEFLKWYFNDYVSKDPSKFEQQMSGIYDAYWGLVENAKRIGEQSKCLNQEAPADLIPINIKYESEFGSIEIWEEKAYAEEYGKEILTPFMKVWIFPPKEFVKDMLKQAMEKGTLPGPEGEKQQMGPSPAEMEQMRNDPQAMKMITDLSNKFGGQARALIAVKDKEELVYQIFVNIDPDTLITIKPTKDAPSDIDVNVDIEFEYLYSLIEASEKDMRGARIESPEWAKKRSLTSGLKQAQSGVKMITKAITGFATGKIKVEPLSAITKVAPIMKQAMSQGGN